jgi:outer membrane protein TolC
LTEDELSRISSASLAAVDEGQEPITGALSLSEAVARALKYNLDHQVEVAETALRERELEHAHFSMLPSITGGDGYADRNSVNASSSQNVFTGEESLATSTSQDRELRTRDASFGWNILDFGLSYVRARQAADKVLIQDELRRKVILRIIDETRTAYWRAFSAQRLLGQLHRVEAQARQVEHDARTMSADKQSSPITALTYEREIVEIQRTLGELARDLKEAHARLAALINVRPGTHFTLSGSDWTARVAPAGDMTELILVALRNRPELREVAYQHRINEHEAHAALLELLPGFNIYAATNYDSNSFLYDPHWHNWGFKASANLIKVFAYPARRAVVEGQDDLLQTKALAVTMAIITQVHVSRIRYAHAQKELRTAQRYRDVQRRLLAQIRSEAAADRVSQQTLVREEMNMLVAEAKLDIATAYLHSAYAMIESSMGTEPAYAVSAGSSVADIAQGVLDARPRVVQTAGTE